MRIKSPKEITFWISVALAVLGFLGKITAIPFVSDNAFWFVLAGFVLLALGVILKGL